MSFQRSILIKKKFEENPSNKVLDLNVSAKARNSKYQLANRIFFTKELVIKFVFGDQKKCFCYFSCTKNQAA